MSAADGSRHGQRAVALDHVLDVMGNAEIMHPGKGKASPLWIVDCTNPNVPDTRCVMTVGVSALGRTYYSVSNKPAPRHELAMIIHTAEPRENVTPVLAAFAETVFATNEVLDSYSVVPLGPERPALHLSHAFVVNGSPLPADLGTVGSEENNFIILWIVPITEAEAEYSRQHGPSRLMLLLRWNQVDLFDLGRSSVVLPGGLTVDEFESREYESGNACQAILDLVEGESDRARLIDVVSSLLRSDDDEVQECAVETIQALAASEPQSFTHSQIDAVEDSLRKLLASPRAPSESQDALAAVRHARLHIAT